MALDMLTGPDAAELLEAAVSTAGGRLEGWRVTQVDHRGAVTTVAYAATVQWPTGRTDDVLGATSLAPGDEPPRIPGTLTLSDGQNRVCVWRLPDDPGLPGLATAMNQQALSSLLTSFGLDSSGLRTDLVSYRPKRRAVIRISAAGGVIYAKVLPPGDVEALHRRHEMLHGAGVPVPHSLGWTDDGLLLLENLPGTPLRRRLLAPGPDLTAGLPDPHDVIGVLDRFPPGVLGLNRRRPWSRRAPQYAAMVGEALPAEAERARQLAAVVAEGLRHTGLGSDPTHGDFYEAQMMVDPAGRLVGLLDVDTVGPGSRADDLACALAHCEALALSSPRHADRSLAMSRLWRPVFERQVPAEQLRLSTAGVLMSLATGPHRVQRPNWEDATSRMLDRIEDMLRAS
ncbi:aminoglycoside phosphotransferase family protein [Kineosporia sp. J2-2]|uniref:Aminoglycoside phosphotransferase family protein n=1 Tax=Kineosporia corallincola TaxID=2835133 RepID=A0ABS5TJ92_9ACTN|nr:aminoglycoside phosphotransferase family protein [Kineosporia corallincola]MBT0771167.1 aminoglycoside phosphotransferase family protein [Kineosporia corallincola]